MLKHSVSTIALGIALGLAPAAFAQDTQTQQPAAQDQQGTQQGGADVIVVQPEGQQQEGQQGGADVIVVQPEGQQQGTTTTQPAEGQTTTQPVEVQTTQPAEGETTTQPVEVQTTTQPAETTTEPVEVQTTTEPAEDQQMQVETEPAEGQEMDVQAQEGQPVPGQIFQQSPNQFLASTLMDADVQSADGENMGSVENIIITQEGQVEGVVIGVGGFLGIGQKNVAVELNQITIQQDPNNPENLTFVLNSTREELENAPEFQTQRDVQAQQDAATGAAGTTGAGTTGAGGVTDPAATGGAVTTDPAAGGTTTQSQ